MKKYNNLFKWSLLAIVLTFANCETIDLDQTENPSQLSEDLLDPVYTFNYVQLQLADFVDSANSFTQRVTRQMAMTGGNTYNNAFAPVNFNNNWNLGYNILNAVKIMEPKAIANREYYALGASKVIRVYVLMTMVDMYGNIPYSEALQGSANLNPKFDNSADIYRGLLAELDAAILVLQQSNAPGSKVQDLYYSGPTQWITLANTLKLKMYCNSRLPDAAAELGVDVAAKITEIVAADNFIDEASEDFAFRYGNSRFNPNTRHPMYNDQYEIGGGAYIANYMMWAMTTEKNFATEIVSTGTLTDPRTPFYFYRQKQNPGAYAGDFELPTPSRPPHYDNDEYKSFYRNDQFNLATFIVSNWTGQAAMEDNGFWGRDHGDNSGIPPDGNLRTVGGLYPIGGNYGVDGSVQSGGDLGALGAGIMPMILSSYVHFMLAEVIETGTSLPGRTAIGELEAGIRASVQKTINIVPDYNYKSAVRPIPAILAQQETLYVDFIKAKFNAGGTNKLELIIKEYFLAAWGNGMEPYNAYRRTGYPSNFQPTREPASGDFFSTALYPGNSVVNNPNAPANVRTKKVFWDKAGLTLH
ncbi:MAG: SusD/RagB family nutrient-binding outer membrane lipoprotein [Flavobacterium sp.]|nr:SusD/RagB family nutrient-binding outer membrane lipoprotein [Flavobacterium sp.]